MTAKNKTEPAEEKITQILLAFKEYGARILSRRY
jgi:hypothetical protein